MTALKFCGDHAAVAMGDGTVRFVAAGEDAVSTVAVHRGAILCACLSADGSSLLTGGDDGRVCRVSPVSKEILAEGSEWVEAISWHPTGAIAFAAGKTVTVQRPDGSSFEFGTGRSVGGLTPVSGSILAVAAAGEVALVDLAKDGNQPRRLPRPGLAVSATASPDGRFVIIGTYDGTLHCWRVSDSLDMDMRGYAGKPRSLAWSPDGLWLASSGAGRIVLWPFAGRDGPMGREASTRAPRRSLVTAVAWHPAKMFVAAGYADGCVMLVAHPADYVMTVREPDGNSVTDLAFAADGLHFAYGTERGALGVLKIGDHE